MLDLQLAPTMLTDNVAISLLGGVAWELVGRTRIQAEYEKTRASCAISVVTWHQVDLLVVHDNGTGA